jgi:hypothetical protein
MASKRSLAKASVDPGCTSLLDSEDLKVMSTDRDENAMDDFMRELPNNLAHTLLNFVNLRCRHLIIFKVQ